MLDQAFVQSDLSIIKDSYSTISLDNLVYYFNHLHCREPSFVPMEFLLLNLALLLSNLRRI